MPAPPLPPELEAFLLEPHPAVVATLRPDGSPHSVATWYDWVDGLILLNMDATRARLGHLRLDPRVSLTVLDRNSWYSHVSLAGVVERLVEDPELVDIDRLALRYTDKPFRNRAGKRLSAWVRVERWHEWDVAVKPSP
ncbi:MAG TPA: PPOX class F420-dependent oxidoreductase [Gaiellaceae bacterium]|nr:PPOX class F420-dependent oxidoreductase [Gaiellaceae bacterium]